MARVSTGKVSTGDGNYVEGKLGEATRREQAREGGGRDPDLPRFFSADSAVSRN